VALQPDPNEDPAPARAGLQQDTESVELPQQQSEWTSFAPFANLLGVDLRRTGNGRAEVHFRPRPEFANRKGDIHGGVLASLVDLASSEATRSLDGVEGVATVVMNVSYLQTAVGSVVAHAEVVKAGKSMSFVNIKVLNGNDEPVAIGNVTLRIIRQTR
jgi:uncharacterized protein (TIGR00369 family)